MGAYLSSPICVKESEDGGKEGGLRFGASSMQGWRITQEDAHCCLLDFDPESKTSFFAVFDGHGGAEVAQYTAAHLPAYVRALEAYRASRLDESLEQAFLGFDATLVDPPVVSKLKSIAGDNNEEEEDDEEETAALCEEAEMPLEQILERYGGAAAVGPTANKAILALKKKDKFKSPALRAKPPFLSGSSSPPNDDSDDGVCLQLEASLINGHSESEAKPVTAETSVVSNGSAEIEASAATADTPQVTSASGTSSSTSEAGGDLTDKKGHAGGDQMDKDECTVKNNGADSTTHESNTAELVSDALAAGDRSTSNEESVSRKESVCSDKGVSDDKSMSDNSSVFAEANNSVLADESSSGDKCKSDVHSVSDASNSLHSEDKNGTDQNTKENILQEILNLEMSRAKLGELMATIEEKVDDLDEEVRELNGVVDELDEAGGSEEGRTGLEGGSEERESRAELAGVREETCKKVEELSAELTQHKDRLVRLTAERLELRRRIAELKRTKASIARQEQRACSLSAGQDSGESADDEVDMEDDDDDSDDEDDVPDEGEEEEDEEEEEEEEECAGMMGCGEEPGMDSGCTAVVAVLRGRDLHVANAGDSRCVLCRAGVAVEMSFDHKPEDAVESARILKAGGRVTCDGRVNGGLNLSRAIGDHSYKQNKGLSDREQMITSLPDIKSIVLEDKDEFMVIACDGIWNVMSSQEVVDFVRKRLEAGDSRLSKICEEMFDFCISPDTSGDGTGCDNMTCVIVDLASLSPTNKRKSEDDSENGDYSATKRRKEEVDALDNP